MAANINVKNPPDMKGKTYEQLKNEIAMWQILTDLDKKKRAIAIALSLEVGRKARQKAQDIPAADLNVDGGVQILLTELDKVFEKDKIDRAYSAYTAFDQFKRKEESMSVYIMEYEQKYTQMKKFDMTLPQAVLAFKLLDGANLSKRERQLALTACPTIQFEEMKSALNRIFGDSTGTLNSKQEEDSFLDVNVTESAFRVNSSRLKYEDRPRSRYRFKSSTDSLRVSQKLNPMISGAVSRCRICDSRYHWMKECPTRIQHINNTDNPDAAEENAHITLYTGADTDLTPGEILICEAANSAIIDTAYS
ncbi:uncharacterized protein LOC130010710 [Patella vulgata]|uniref:uncharacterized protein LOC130010710 n=1 Tax=Patella vulgata TaxID=6465 RepID=UPI0024A87352|nr:uncharacterized protein LOC130010710 [Patella vulgata]